MKHILGLANAEANEMGIQTKAILTTREKCTSSQHHKPQYSLATILLSSKPRTHMDSVYSIHSLTTNCLLPQRKRNELACLILL